MSRVQGSWAASSTKKTAAKKASEKFAPSRANVLYQEGLEKPRIKPDDILIRDSGDHVLSEGPSGESRIAYFPNFLTQHQADDFFSHLLEELPWSQQSDDFGPHNRLTAWFGEHDYAYAGLTHPAYTEWNPILTEILTMIESLASLHFKNEQQQQRRPKINSVLCNLYRNGKDGVGWHSDDETGLRERPFIASVSLGETRTFEMRKKPEQAPYNDFTFSQHIKLHLIHGSLLIMKDWTQNDWQHRVPTEYHDRGPRINLTYRTIYPIEY